MTGFNYNPNDYVGFAKGIMTLISDSGLHDEISEYNKTFANQFSVEESTKNMEAIYDELLL